MSNKLKTCDTECTIRWSTLLVLKTRTRFNGPIGKQFFTPILHKNQQNWGLMWNIQKMVARQRFENRHRTEMNAVANLLHIVYPSIQICHVLKILAKNSNFQSVTETARKKKTWVLRPNGNRSYDILVTCPYALLLRRTLVGTKQPLNKAHVPNILHSARTRMSICAYAQR